MARGVQRAPMEAREARERTQWEGGGRERGATGEMGKREGLGAC